MARLFRLILLGLLNVVPAAAAAGDDKVAVHATWFRPATGAAYVYLRNNTGNPVSLAKLSIDGRPESAAPWPLDPNRQADWFDCIPETVAPGQIAQVRVHLREPARTQPVALTIETSDGTRTNCTIPAEPPALAFSDITFARDGRGASLFVHGDATITQVFLDGRDATTACDLRGATAFHGTAAVFYQPAEPLARGSYHTWEARTADGRRAIYTARTLANDFILGTYGKADFSPYRDNGLNHYIAFGNLTPSKLNDLGALGMTGGFVPFVGGEIDKKTKEFKPIDADATRANLRAGKGNAAVAYYSAPDEPDGADYPLGVGTHGRSIIAMRQLAASVDPATPCFVQIDNTYRNRNYHVYAEAMDYSSTHRYNLGQDFLAGDRAAMKELRDAAAPLPYLWVTQLYPVRDKVGEAVGYNGRDPLPAEMHLQMLESLAGGTKGFIHYIHSGSGGGRGGSGLNTDLWSSMAPMHRQIAVVGPVAVRSTPVDWAASTTPRVHAQALLCDASNVLVVLTNDAIVSTKQGATVPEITDAQVTVALPDWVHVTGAVEVLPGGELAPRPVVLKNTPGASLSVARLGVGTILWLKGAH